MTQENINIQITKLHFDELTTSQKKLLNTAKAQTETAYAPYSNFKVGVSLLLANGEIISGNNQENSAYPTGLCAERVAIFYANSQYPEVAIDTIAIAAFYKNSFLAHPISPCGSCRQVLLESETRHQKKINILLYGTEYIYLIQGASNLLPLNFNKNTLL